MQLDEVLQWCVDNKATYSFSYTVDVDDNKLWSVKVIRGIISAQYPFSTPEEMAQALQSACYAVQLGTESTKKGNLLAMLNKFKARSNQLDIIQSELELGETLCNRCDAKCCKSVSVAIPTPVTKDDFEWLKYYVLHNDVYVAVDITGEWEVVFNTPCRFLDRNQCSIHDDTRPKPCIDHKPPHCEFNMSPNRYIKLHTPEQVDAYYSTAGSQDENGRLLARVPQQTTGDING